MGFIQQIGQARGDFRKELDEIGQRQMEGERKCPGQEGSKEQTDCYRALAQVALPKEQAAARKFLQAADGPFTHMIAKMKSCAQKREAIVQEAKAAGAKGANVKQLLRPLVAAWDLPQQAVQHYEGICADVGRTHSAK